MPTPAGSPASPLRIDLARHVGVEVGRSATARISLGETATRNLAGKTSGTIKLSDLWNKPSIITKGFNTNTDAARLYPGNNLDGLDFPTETTIDPSAQLRIKRRCPGINSTTKGYIGSGDVGYGSTGNYTVDRVVDGLVFNSQTAFTTSASVATNRAGGASVNSSTMGYWGGGYNGLASTAILSSVDAFTFSSETASSTSISSGSRYGPAGNSSSTRGYFGGGNNGGNGYGVTLNEITGIEFSNSTFINPAAGLAVSRLYLGGVNSKTNGYWGGGNFNAKTLTYYGTIDTITFSTETTRNTSASLSFGRKECSGLNSSSRGYFCGGDNAQWGQTIVPTREIDGIDFSTETSINPSAALVIGRMGQGSFQDYGNNP